MFAGEYLQEHLFKQWSTAQSTHYTRVGGVSHNQTLITTA